MSTSVVARLANIPEDQTHPGLENLPEDTQIVTGSIIGHGTTELATEKAKLSAKIVKLERNSSGGIDYQVAIFVSEPTPAPVVKLQDIEDPKLTTAIDYFVSKGLTGDAARKKVAEFGIERVLNARERELDAELQKELGKSV